MQTSQNQHALIKILDMTRLISMVVLGIHFYFHCYTAFLQWGLVWSFSDKLLENIGRTGLFETFNRAKLISAGFLVISLLGASGKKVEKLSLKTGLFTAGCGLILFFASQLTLYVPLQAKASAIFYISAACGGFLLILSGGTLVSRVIYQQLSQDIFNIENETFPQQQQLWQNEYSINLPGRYRLKNRFFKSWINITNPFRGLLVLGSPGSGKSYFVIRHVITQHIRKGFSMFVYDFKHDDLSRIAYNAYLSHRHAYTAPPDFFCINFDDLSRTHRCNPLEPSGMVDITDAAESARTILMGLNREWIRKQGDFFVESPINFMTAVIWFLRRYQDGAFCTLPHVLELMQVDYDSLFTLLRTQSDVNLLINPFITAYLNNAMEQLEGQVGSAKIALARLSSPSLYYVLSGNDFTLDINNPEAPKIVCMGNNPQKIMTYGAVLSLYVNRMIKTVNQKGKLKSSLIFDEFPTIYLSGIDNLIATARSSQVATTLGIQDFSQLKKDYGKDHADVILNITGNIISGQVSGETAKHLSERFGKINQDRSSLSINRSDTSLSRSKQLELAIPASKISALSSGEFVGTVADDPDRPLDLKAFHCQIQNDHQQIKAQQQQFQPLPLIRNVNPSIVQQSYEQIKKDVQNIVDQKMQQVLSDPTLSHLLVSKRKKQSS